MKKMFFAGLLFFAAHHIGHAQSQLPPVKQGTDAPQVKVKAELPLKGGGAQTASQIVTPDTRQVLTHSLAQGLTQGTGQGSTQGAAQGPSQATGVTKNVSPLKAAGAAGSAKPAAQSATGSQTVQNAHLKGGGNPSGTAQTTAATSTTGAVASGKGATVPNPSKLPIKTSNN